MGHGIRKINEYVLENGRALILTKDVSTDISETQWNHIADGTMLINPASGDLKYKNLNSKVLEWEKLKPENLFDYDTIGGEFLKDKIIKESHMSDGSISNRCLKDNSVTSNVIGYNAIKDYHIADNAINGSSIKDKSISIDKLAGDLDGTSLEDRSIEAIKLKKKTLTNEELSDYCIKSNNLSNSCVTESAISSDSISSSKIKDRAILERTIADGAISNIKLGQKSVDWKNLMDNSVRTSAILDLSITNSKLAENSVTNDKILDGSITGEKLAKGTITAECIAPGAITIDSFSDEAQNAFLDAVIHKDGVANVYGDLQVDGDIRSTSTDKSQSITGFKVFNPVFADYAEGFFPSEDIEVGHIVEIDSKSYIKKADAHSQKIVGIVSDRYGMCLDASEYELKHGTKVAVGLMGKVPVKVAGQVEAGDYIISSGDGVGIATKKHYAGQIVGRALEDKYTFGLGTVLCLIQPM